MPPLSYLFIISSEALSALLRQNELGGQLRGLKLLPLPPSISHLFFADDSLLFASMDELSVSSLEQPLSNLCRPWTGDQF